MFNEDLLKLHLQIQTNVWLQIEQQAPEREIACFKDSHSALPETYDGDHTVQNW